MHRPRFAGPLFVGEHGKTAFSDQYARAGRGATTRALRASSLAREQVPLSHVRACLHGTNSAPAIKGVRSAGCRCSGSLRPDFRPGTRARGDALRPAPSRASNEFDYARVRARGRVPDRATLRAEAVNRRSTRARVEEVGLATDDVEIVKGIVLVKLRRWQMERSRRIPVCVSRKRHEVPEPRRPCWPVNLLEVAE